MEYHPKLATTYSLRKTDKETEKYINPKYQGLYEAVRAAFTPENAETLSLWVSVQHELTRYGLGQSETASSILNIAVLRGKKSLDKGKTIPNPLAWLRLACRFIIKEKSRAKRREVQLESADLIANQVNLDEDLVEVAYCHPEYAVLRKELQNLSELDRTILTLNVVHNLRWKAVQAQLVEMGHKPYSLSALRKRKSRALCQLREGLKNRNE